MRLLHRPVLFSLLLPLLAVVWIGVPALTLAAEDMGTSSSRGLTGGNDNLGVTGLLQIATGGGPVFSNAHPVMATEDQYDPISISYLDPDGVDAASVQLTFDDYLVTECATPSLLNSLGITRNANSISWNHTTITERGRTRCRVIATEIQAMADGAHSATVTATDTLGNTSSYSWSFVIDAKPPVITPSLPCGTTTDDNTPTISFSYSDVSGIDTASVSMYIDDAWTSATGNAAEVIYTPAPLDDGLHEVHLEIADNGGNTASSDCYFTVDTAPPAITSVTPADGGNAGTAPRIHATWSDEGAGIDQDSASLKLDGIDVTSQATVDEYGASYQAYGLALGNHTVEAGISDRTGKTATKTWSFTAVESVSWYAPWYDSRPANDMKGNWIIISNQDSSDAAVDIYIGGQKMTPQAAMADEAGQHFLVKAGSRITPQFANIAAGPVQVISTNSKELLVSQRVLFRDSFNEVMAVRESDLDSEYRFTWYDDKPENGMRGNWVLVSNVDSTSATVDVYVAGERQGTYDIAPGDIKTPQFPGLMAGPVSVSSRGGQKLVVSQRVIFKNAFTEVMGVPVSQLDDEYYFTWYDDKPENGMRGNWVLVSNENASAAAYVYIDIGGQRMKDPARNPADPDSERFLIPAGGSVTPQFPGLMDGPVKVTCASCQEYGGKIMASQRVIFKDSFEEVQGTSPAQMGASAVFAWYDLLSPQIRGDWILAGNDSSRAETVSISIDGAPMMNAATATYGFDIAGFDNITPSFPTIMGSPVTVNCTSCAGQKLIVSQRVIYLDSFNEVVGKPPLVP